MSRERSAPLVRAVARTVARYESAPRSAKHYVAAKLRFDPVLDVISALGVHLGETVDAGAGRGQCGLCLAELGLISRLTGFDWDEKKVALANEAANGRGTYVEGDLATHVFDSDVDTVLLIDVLHYLSVAEQDQLLHRAFASLRPQGRLLIRDVNAEGWQSVWTQMAERIGSALGINRARVLAFRSASEFSRVLEQLGASVSRHSASEGPLTNVLLVAEKPATRSASEAHP